MKLKVPENPWHDIRDILVHHNIVCKHRDLDDEYPYIVYNVKGNKKVRELNLFYCNNEELYMKIFDDRGKGAVIVDCKTNHIDAAIIAAHELRNKECKYCVV